MAGNWAQPKETEVVSRRSLSRTFLDLAALWVGKVPDEAFAEADR